MFRVKNETIEKEIRRIKRNRTEVRFLKFQALTIKSTEMIKIVMLREVKIQLIAFPFEDRSPSPVTGDVLKSKCKL